jgi:NADH-quinone oxidoreductase subunit C
MSTEQTIRDSFPDAILESSEVDGALTLRIDPKQLLAICKILHSEPELGFDYLADVTAIDWKDRFELVYRMTNLAANTKIVFRLDLDHEKPEVDSVTSIWRGADYQEREVFDLMGVVFTGHPNLKRILLPDDWEGYPLRKDYVIPD